MYLKVNGTKLFAGSNAEPLGLIWENFYDYASVQIIYNSL